MEPLLELKNISHAYHTKGGETSALSNLSFQVFPGEFLAIIGPCLLYTSDAADE